MNERILIVVGIVLWLVVIGALCGTSGCAWLQRIGDAIVNVEPKPGITIPDTSKVQLWETIKGLTPNWLAIPVIAMGGVVMWYGSFKLGMAFVIFGSTNLFMALATSRFGFWMALCGLIGTIAALVSAMLAKNKAIRELVFNGQKLKEEVIEDSYIPRAKEILARQVKSTKKIVAKVKNELRMKGEI